MLVKTSSALNMLFVEFGTFECVVGEGLQESKQYLWKWEEGESLLFSGKKISTLNWIV